MPPRTKPSEGASSCEGPSLPSAIPDADSEHTASVPVQPIRVHSGCRTVDTQNRPANGRQPGTPGTPLRWQTVTGTRSGSSEMLGVPRHYTTPCGLLKQPDKQKASSLRQDHTSTILSSSLFSLAWSATSAVHSCTYKLHIRKNSCVAATVAVVYLGSTSCPERRRVTSLAFLYGMTP